MDGVHPPRVIRERKRSCLGMPPISVNGYKLQRNHRKDGVGKILILPFTQVSVMSE